MKRHFGPVTPRASGKRAAEPLSTTDMEPGETVGFPTGTRASGAAGQAESRDSVLGGRP